MQVFDLLDKNIDCEVKKIFCRIPSGEITAVGDEDLLQMDARKHSLINSRMARTSGWHQIEGWGCWAAKREARIQFLSDLMAGQKIRLYLDLTLPMDLQSAQLIINTHEIKNQEIYINKKQSWYTCDAVVSEHGGIDLSIISVGKSFPTDARGTLYFGLRQLGYCLYDNASSRVDFLEKVGSVMKACTPIIVDKTPEKDNYPVLLMQKMLFQNAAFFVASSLDEPDITLFNVGIYRWFLHIYNLRMARQS
jgi:hypothetical protein